MLTPYALLLGTLTAPALVVALSPLPVALVLVVLVHSERPRSASIAYLAGRLLALTTVTALFVRAPRFLDALHGPVPLWADGVMLALGAAMIGLAGWIWARRGDVGAPAPWQNRVGRLTPAVSATIGTLPTMANPKVLAAGAAAGVKIGTLDLTAAGTAAAVVYFAVLASATIAAPIAAYLLLGPRIDPQLDRVRSWLHRRQRAVTALALLAAGIAVLVYGLA
ncbi:MAG: GAP family protein [Mycobacterium sp.]|nr:MAG: GAP family protein [Mycobacterium sp.]